MTTLRSRVAEGRGPRRYSFERKLCDEFRRPLHHASRGPPSPAFAGAEDKFSRSRGAIFVRARVLCPTMLLTASPLALFPGFPCAHPGRKQRGSGTPRDASSQPAPCGHGAPLAGALASRRPTAALARETAGPQGSAPGHASGDSPERSILYGRPNRGAETLRCSTGVTRAELELPRTVSTSRAGHDAGRLMPDAARERVTNPPAGTALAPSQGVSSRRTSLRKARWSLLVRRAGGIQEIPQARAICLIRRDSFFAVCLIRSAANCDYAAMIRLFCANSRTHLCFRSFDSRNMIRHPEVAAKRPSKDAAEAPGRRPSRLAPLAPQGDGNEFAGWAERRN